MERLRAEVEDLTGPMMRSGNGYKGFCPAHDDASMSLSIFIGEADGRPHINCFADCSMRQIFSALDLKRSDFDVGSKPLSRIGHTNGHTVRLNRRDEKEPDPGQLGPEVERYPYRDETGRTLYYNIRHEPKTFRMETADGRRSMKAVRRVPYNLPAVIAAVARGETIYWVEGEKDVRTLAQHGRVGTTAAGGAQQQILPEWGEYFDCADLVVIADNDQIGKTYAKRVASTFVNRASRVRVAHPGLDEPKSDITDHFAVGLGLDELRWQPNNIVRRTQFGFHQLKAVPPRSQKWLIPGLIPQGSGVTLLVGAPKAGKSWFNLQLYMAIASGDFPGLFSWGDRVDPGACLYLALEDSDWRLSSRINQMQGNVTVPPSADKDAAVWLDLPSLSHGGTDEIRSWLDDHPNAKAVLVDVLAKVREDGDSEGNSYQRDYQAIEVFKDLSAEYDVQFIVTHHDRKKKHDGDFFDQVSGTKGLTGAVDTVVYLKRQRGQQEGTIELSGRDVEEAKYDLQFVPEYGRWEIVGPTSFDDDDREDESGKYKPRVGDLQQAIMMSLEQGPQSLTGLTRVLGKSKSTVHEALQRLADKELAVQTVDKHWQLAPAHDRE
jgi:biotin operon repressor